MWYGTIQCVFRQVDGECAKEVESEIKIFEKLLLRYVVKDDLTTVKRIRSILKRLQEELEELNGSKNSQYKNSKRSVRFVLDRDNEEKGGPGVRDKLSPEVVGKAVGVAA